jgi:hypothetical protein
MLHKKINEKSTHGRGFETGSGNFGGAKVPIGIVTRAGSFAALPVSTNSNNIANTSGICAASGSNTPWKP